MAYTSERAHALECFELTNQEGPCLDCFRAGEAIVATDLELDPPRWPLFAPQARSAGFRSVQALPMRLRDQVIGALNVFHQDPLPLDEDNGIAARTLADIAAIGLLQERVVTEARVLAEQLHSALNSRVVIEQAKGIIAERTQLHMDEAFTLIPTYARRNNLPCVTLPKPLFASSLSAGDLGHLSG